MALSRDFLTPLLLSVFSIGLMFACQSSQQDQEIKRIKKEINIVDKVTIPEAWKRFQPNEYENGFLAYDFHKKSIFNMFYFID